MPVYTCIILHMRHDKDDAAQLRKSGKTYREIEYLLKVPRSTLSEWFGALEWSQKVRKNTDAIARVGHRARIIKLDRIRGEKLKETYAEARREAQRELDVFKYHPLFITGLTIYWGEGDKTGRGSVRVGTTDPVMLKVFKRFLEEICGVDESHIRTWLLLYPDLDENESKQYWIREVGISPDSFIKSTVIQGRHKSRRVRYGVCAIYTSSNYLKEKIMEWLRLFPIELIDKKYYATIEDTQAGMV